MTQTPSPNYPTLHLNWEDWTDFLEDSDAPDPEKRAMIEALWSIVVGFVDFGWDISSGDKICGEEIDLTTLLNAAVVNSDNTQNTKKEAV
jgi:hypothetical protein